MLFLFSIICKTILLKSGFGISVPLPCLLSDTKSYNFYANDVVLTSSREKWIVQSCTKMFKVVANNPLEWRRIDFGKKGKSKNPPNGFKSEWDLFAEYHKQYEGVYTVFKVAHTILFEKPKIFNISNIIP